VEPPEVARDYEPIHPGTNWRELGKRLVAPIAVGIGAVAKYGFAFAKFGSIFVAVGGYALIWGWRIAIGFVALILIHELGISSRPAGSACTRTGRSSALLERSSRFRTEQLTPWRLARIALAGPCAGHRRRRGVLGRRRVDRLAAPAGARLFRLPDST
jgi:hypothetical protein